MARILLIDDDEDLTDFLRPALEKSGYLVTCLNRAEEGPDAVAVGGVDLVLLDNRMPGMSGIDFLEALQGRGLRATVILMTGQHDDRTAIGAINLGAFDYVLKPTGYEELAAVLDPLIRKALEITRPIGPVRLDPADGPGPEDSWAILGNTQAMLEVLKRIGRFARRDDPVLILGENGTGKELVARALHTHSPRRDKPFVVMNCAGFNEHLLESELFGHEKGAFTGADKLRKGRFEHAAGGTLFLDELGDMPLTLQAKLLRVLENREVTRVGGNAMIRVDVRLVSATNRDLAAAVREGRFRQDLFYRLEGVSIHLPPLRERGADVSLLARRFLARLTGGAGSGPVFHDSALARLCGYDWPGNVRQLQKVVCRAVGLCTGSYILPEHLDFGQIGGEVAVAPPASQEEAVAGLRRAIVWAWESGRSDLWPMLHDLLERELLEFARDRLDGNRTQMAERLKMVRGTVIKRMQYYSL
jgi:two-component system NtrC family response regulator/two-component system nitrogen regulation response regulator GlnG